MLTQVSYHKRSPSKSSSDSSLQLSLITNFTGMCFRLEVSVKRSARGVLVSHTSHHPLCPFFPALLRNLLASRYKLSCDCLSLDLFTNQGSLHHGYLCEMCDHPSSSQIRFFCSVCEVFHLNKTAVDVNIPRLVCSTGSKQAPEPRRCIDKRFFWLMQDFHNYTDLYKCLCDKQRITRVCIAAIDRKSVV